MKAVSTRTQTSKSLTLQLFSSTSVFLVVDALDLARNIVSVLHLVTKITVEMATEAETTLVRDTKAVEIRFVVIIRGFGRYLGRLLNCTEVGTCRFSASTD